MICPCLMTAGCFRRSGRARVHDVLVICKLRTRLDGDCVITAMDAAMVCFSLGIPDAGHSPSTASLVQNEVTGSRMVTMKPSRARCRSRTSHLMLVAHAAGMPGSHRLTGCKVRLAKTCKWSGAAVDFRFKPKDEIMMKRPEFTRATSGQEGPQ